MGSEKWAVWIYIEIILSSFYGGPPSNCLRLLLEHDGWLYFFCTCIICGDVSSFTCEF